ncbi:WYL domain-containing protein [Ensifer adhaerens]|jgi:hypothetical protein|uniref:WYL domain-containing protein n=1 Tax=Ensifer adhaerens TaxID=106592 RepID=UPI00202F042B|nr:WYL domain-containing protein [Ensifer adhaerens]
MINDGNRPWTQNRRLEFIEWKLYWEGMLNRSDLEDAFSISTPQASVDLRHYREVAGGNIDYSLSEKAYRPTADMNPRFFSPSADRLLLQLRAWLTGVLPRKDLWFKRPPQLDMTPDIARPVDSECLRRVLGAMSAKEALDVRYQSLTNSRWRKIAPHALAFDGFRWHIRAWSCDTEDFRDFVLSRISEIGEGCPADFSPEDDIQWNTRTILQLCPHPELTDDQRRAIEQDYNMKDGRLEIEVRLSMAYYFIMRMNLDLDDLPPARAQIRLQNLAEIQSTIESARIEARECLARRKGDP